MNNTIEPSTSHPEAATPVETTFSGLLRRFGRRPEDEYHLKVALPARHFSPSGEGHLVIVQPVHAQELLLADFLAGRSAETLRALRLLIEKAGAGFWASHDAGLLAVGTSTFGEEYWKGVARDAQHNRLAEFRPLLQRKGEDIDLVLLVDDSEARTTLGANDAAGVPQWITVLQEPLRAREVVSCIESDYDNGAFIYPFTLTMTAGNSREAELDEDPCRTKLHADGCHSLKVYLGGVPLHIRANFSGPSSHVLAAERAYGLSFVELFVGGDTQHFMDAMAQNMEQRKQRGDDDTPVLKTSKQRTR